MSEQFHDRLLDESLKQYSRVEPPAGFEERLAARAERPRVWKLWWFLAPAAAAALGVAMFVKAPDAVPPVPMHVVHVSPRPAEPAPPIQKVRIATQAARSRYHTLTGAELARLSDFPELFAKREEKPVADLEIPDLVVTPLEKEQ